MRACVSASLCGEATPATRVRRDGAKAERASKRVAVYMGAGVASYQSGYERERASRIENPERLLKTATSFLLTAAELGDPVPPSNLESVKSAAGLLPHKDHREESNP